MCLGFQSEPKLRSTQTRWVTVLTLFIFTLSFSTFARSEDDQPRFNDASALLERTQKLDIEISRAISAAISRQSEAKTAFFAVAKQVDRLGSDLSFFFATNPFSRASQGSYVEEMESATLLSIHQSVLLRQYFSQVERLVDIYGRLYPGVANEEFFNKYTVRLNRSTADRLLGALTNQAVLSPDTASPLASLEITYDQESVTLRLSRDRLTLERISSRASVPTAEQHLLLTRGALYSFWSDKLAMVRFLLGRDHEPGPKPPDDLSDFVGFSPQQQVDDEPDQDLRLRLGKTAEKVDWGSLVQTLWNDERFRGAYGVIIDAREGAPVAELSSTIVQIGQTRIAEGLPVELQSLVAAWPNGVTDRKGMPDSRTIGAVFMSALAESIVQGMAETEAMFTGVMDVSGLFGLDNTPEESAEAKRSREIIDGAHRRLRAYVEKALITIQRDTKNGAALIASMTKAWIDAATAEPSGQYAANQISRLKWEAEVAAIVETVRNPPEEVSIPALHLATSRWMLEHQNDKNFKHPYLGFSTPTLKYLQMLVSAEDYATARGWYRSWIHTALQLTDEGLPLKLLVDRLSANVRSDRARAKENPPPSRTGGKNKLMDRIDAKTAQDMFDMLEHLAWIGDYFGFTRRDDCPPAYTDLVKEPQLVKLYLQARKEIEIDKIPILSSRFGGDLSAFDRFVSHIKPVRGLYNWLSKWTWLDQRDWDSNLADELAAKNPDHATFARLLDEALERSEERILDNLKTIGGANSVEDLRAWIDSSLLSDLMARFPSLTDEHQKALREILYPARHELALDDAVHMLFNIGNYASFSPGLIAIISLVDGNYVVAASCFTLGTGVFSRFTKGVPVLGDIPPFLKTAQGIAAPLMAFGWFHTSMHLIVMKDVIAKPVNYYFSPWDLSTWWIFGKSGRARLFGALDDYAASPGGEHVILGEDLERSHQQFQEEEAAVLSNMLIVGAFKAYGIFAKSRFSKPKIYAFKFNARSLMNPRTWFTPGEWVLGARGIEQRSAELFGKLGWKSDFQWNRDAIGKQADAVAAEHRRAGRERDAQEVESARDELQSLLRSVEKSWDTLVHLHKYDLRTLGLKPEGLTPDILAEHLARLRKLMGSRALTDSERRQIELAVVRINGTFAHMRAITSGRPYLQELYLGRFGEHLPQEIRDILAGINTEGDPELWGTTLSGRRVYVLPWSAATASEVQDRIQKLRSEYPQLEVEYIALQESEGRAARQVVALSIDPLSRTDTLAKLKKDLSLKPDDERGITATSGLLNILQVALDETVTAAQKRALLEPLAKRQARLLKSDRERFETVARYDLATGALKKNADGFWFRDRAVPEASPKVESILLLLNESRHYSRLADLVVKDAGATGEAR